MLREVPLSSVHRLLAPKPVCLLTARYKGRVNAMAACWVGPISLEPPLVALAVHPARYTHDLLARSEECVLSIPARPMAELVMKVGSVSGANEDKAVTCGLRFADAQRVDAPRIEGCLAYLECAVLERLAPGDHSLFVAQVVGAWAEEEAYRDTWLLPEGNEELTPLVYLGGSAFCLPGKRLSVSGAE